MQLSKKAPTFLALSYLLLANSPSKEKAPLLISIDSDSVSTVTKHLTKGTKLVNRGKKVSWLQVKQDNVPALGQLMHEHYGRCGGFIVESNLANALAAQQSIVFQKFSGAPIHQSALVHKAMQLVEEGKLHETIQTLSGYRNRYYTAPTGEQSQEWIGRRWQELTANRSDVELQLFEHAEYPQKSVIFTIKGRKKPDEILVIGGHGDSINAWNSEDDVEAPGADDNA